MSIHKLTAGSGYDYLTRQVAALDATDRGRVGLADYYAARGESPGVWLGSGLAGLGGLTVGDAVTAEQMKALFGLGLHPLAAERGGQLILSAASEGEVRAATRLGTPFRISDGAAPFGVEVARRVAAAGAASEGMVAREVRARIRTEVGAELFQTAYGRGPADARELASFIAKASRPRGAAVAGFDLTFSPVKSVSALWALADPATAAAIERAHRAAVGDALAFVEGHALFSREGRNGVRQVDVRGLIAAAFTHRDSRAGDPDLHTHVAVANKVQTREGRWLAVDGRVLFKATVAASEVYNTALEQRLGNDLGVVFAARAVQDPRLRPVREIVGVDPRLNTRWSARRQVIEVRRSELATGFQARHGRPPTAVEMLQLAQQATLETRQAKHEPRSLHEQRATWRAQALEVLGGPPGLAAMLHHAFTPARPPVAVPDPTWFAHTARRVLAAVESRGATWQVWHVRAESLRHVRGLNVPPAHTEAVVDRLVAEVARRSVPLAGPADGIVEPPTLRRRDGSSVYRVAGADLFTSSGVLAAEERLLATAALTGGRTVDRAAVEQAFRDLAVDGPALNGGQKGLVRAMAGSGARLQLAIAPAGAGKTTALRALARAWTGSGGTVVGLAPSASAAAQLRDQIGTDTDTLAKLTWSLQAGDQPEWVRSIGPSTLVIIDEAGMADTLTIDAAVTHIVAAGGSVRLVGDDQQLAAVGVGGVLTDIAARHGALRLSELVRFTDPAEAAASLALRDGQPEALGFYLDRHRVHVGDLTTATEQLFIAWQTDQAAGLDAIMLAPTRDLAANLNARARAARLSTTPTPNGSDRDGSNRNGSGRDGSVTLADGNTASTGDLVITRSNDRRLRTSERDWVRNGDRWLVGDVHRNGDVTVCRISGGRSLRLPASYVTASVELGYATTVHTAQGVTADTMHGIVTGDESRQHLYTMLTRGRRGNHVYLPLVGDGDPHTAITPDTLHPRTATEMLEQVLARDGAARSAATERDHLADPVLRLGDATARYVDALHHAAEFMAGPDALARLDATANQTWPRLTDEPAWPTLRSHLLLLSVGGADPASFLSGAVAGRELTSADDVVAVLDWRLGSRKNSDRAGPLPWLPAVPAAMADHPAWGSYLRARTDLVTDLLTEVVTPADGDSPAPVWAGSAYRALPRELLDAVAVWRAATQVSADDLRPTGPVQRAAASRAWQEHLESRLADHHDHAVSTILDLLGRLGLQLDGDPFTPRLASRLAALNRQGADPATLLRSALEHGPLPDDSPAAALWWRVVGTGLTDHATQDPERAALTPAPAPPTPPPFARIPGMPPANPLSVRPDLSLVPDGENRWVEPDLAVAAMLRDVVGPLEPDDAELARMAERAHAWDTSPVSRGRLLEVNRLTLDFYRDQLPHSWAHHYLNERLRTDLSSDERFRPGYAPAGWTRLVEHLRRADVPDQEMLTAAVAVRARHGGLIDRFRDRAIFPLIADGGDILGFVGRRHAQADDRHGPRYLNTADTPLFHKGDQLYGHHLLADHPSDSSAAATATMAGGTSPTPVLVEGPMDAIAVTLAGDGRYIGVAPLGVALTEQQAGQLAAHGRDPIVATDGDQPGQEAAARHYWLLAAHRLDPRHAALPDGTDPADHLHRYGPATLAAGLESATALADTLTRQALAPQPTSHETGTGADPSEALRILAARPSRFWNRGSDTISAAYPAVPSAELRQQLLTHVTGWNTDPRQAARNALSASRATWPRKSTGQAQDRWQSLADSLDRRLVGQDDWPTVVALLHRLDQQGHDVAALARRVLTASPLGDRPAEDLHSRLVGHLARTPKRAGTTRGTPPQVSAYTRRYPLPKPNPPAGADRVLPR